MRSSRIPLRERCYCAAVLGSSIWCSFVPDAAQGRERGHSCQGVQVQLSGVWLKMSTVWFGIEVLCFQVEASTSKSSFLEFQSLRRRRALHPEVASPIHDSDDIRTLTLSILTGLGTSKASTPHPRDCALRGLLAQQSAKNRSQLQLRPAGWKGLQHQGVACFDVSVFGLRFRTSGVPQEDSPCEGM